MKSFTSVCVVVSGAAVVLLGAGVVLSQDEVAAPQAKGEAIVSGVEVGELGPGVEKIGLPTGACCMTCDAGVLTSCVEVTELVCAASEGTYTGDGVNCADAPCECEADINGDCFSNAFDFAIFAVNFGLIGVTRAQGDLDCDGDVDVFDFSLFSTDFGCQMGGCCFAAGAGGVPNNFEFTTKKACAAKDPKGVFVTLPCGEYDPAWLADSSPVCCTALLKYVLARPPTNGVCPSEFHTALLIGVESAFGIESVTVDGNAIAFADCPTSVEYDSRDDDPNPPDENICFVQGDVVLVEVVLCDGCGTKFELVTVPNLP